MAVMGFKSDDIVDGVAAYYVEMANLRGGAPSIGFTPSGGTSRQVMSGVRFLVGGEVGVGKADDSTALQFLGGVRATKGIGSERTLFADGLAGLLHFPGENVFMPKPRAGILFPAGGRKFDIQVHGGLPVVFFGGNTEIGYEVGGGGVFYLKR